MTKQKQSSKDDKVDKALKETFPASDPPTFGKSTANEAPLSPAGRKAPIISKEDVEAARRGDGHKQGK